VVALRQALNDEDFRVRYSAAEALGDIGSPELLPELCEMLLKTVDNYELNTVLDAIASLQERCGYYNYAIATS